MTQQQKESIWTRMGQWMKPSRRMQDSHTGEMSQADQDSSVVEPFDEHDEKLDDVPNRLMPWRRREETLQRLQQGYDQLLKLMESIQDYQSRQSTYNERAADSLNRMAEGVTDWPEAIQSQSEKLTQLASQVERSNRQLQQNITDILSGWPESARVQREILQAISDRLETSAQGTDQLVHHLGDIGQTLQSLGQSVNLQVQTLNNIQNSELQERERIFAVLETQSRKMSWLVASVIGLLVVLVILTGVSLLN